jgi:hypothetical protein
MTGDILQLNHALGTLPKGTYLMRLGSDVLLWEELARKDQSDTIELRRQNIAAFAVMRAGFVPNRAVLTREWILRLPNGQMEWLSEAFLDGDFNLNYVIKAWTENLTTCIQ